MFGKILTVDGPVQAPEPDDGVGQEHLHPELTEDKGQKEWVNRRLGRCGTSQGPDSLPPSSRRLHLYK